MVKEVHGYCDRFYISFTRRGDTDLWDAVVPFEADGEYVVSLYATDYAGNESYFATVLFTVKRFCIIVRILDISARAKAEGFMCSKVKHWIRAKDMEKNTVHITDFSMASDYFSHYKLRATRCEKCGGV